MSIVILLFFTLFYLNIRIDKNIIDQKYILADPVSANIEIYIGENKYCTKTWASLFQNTISASWDLYPNVFLPYGQVQTSPGKQPCASRPYCLSPAVLLQAVPLQQSDVQPGRLHAPAPGPERKLEALLSGQYPGTAPRAHAFFPEYRP